MALAWDYRGNQSDVVHKALVYALQNAYGSVRGPGRPALAS